MLWSFATPTANRQKLKAKNQQQPPNI